MDSPIRSQGPAVWVLALALASSFVSCSKSDNPKAADMAASPKPGISVALVRGKDLSSDFELPDFAFSSVVPEGNTPYQTRAGAVFASFATDASIVGVVTVPSPKGMVEAARRTRPSMPKTIWIMVSPEDDALVAESVADLVVEVDPAQARAPAFDRALERGLCELARRAGLGKARVDDPAEIAGALRSAGGYNWKVVYRVDPATGVKAKAHVILSAKPRS